MNRALFTLRLGQLAFLAVCFLATVCCSAAPAPSDSASGDAMLARYFRAETKLLSDRCLSEVHSLADWSAERPKLRAQLFEMLGLSPLPERTDLKPVVTGKLDAPEFTVEKLHFQSLPGLYVTANLYLPKNLAKPAPAILYVCGHAYVITNGVSYGNKTAYQHHGAWFARNGYVCLIIDTIQLGEIQGVHHGTYREGMWWWNSRGYTPAGVEAWNCMRALDYLQSRPEVDPERLGVTGRSGGGAYSWWLAALDDRIKVAAPVAGITDLQNHVVDGTVEGHCDCMFMVNTYRWDFPAVAALVAPRPLLICNSDKDTIFPLDGVERLHSKVARIYALYGAAKNLGLLITDGPHQDTQDLQLPVFRWFNRHLKGEDPLIEMAAKPFFTAAQLKVFDTLPADERTSKIHETFVPLAPRPELPSSAADWNRQVDSWKAVLQEKVFGGWPSTSTALELRLLAHQTNSGQQLDVYEFSSQHDVPLRLYLLRNTAGPAPTHARLTILDADGWKSLARYWSGLFPDALRQERDALGQEGVIGMNSARPAWPSEVQVFFAPRGFGLSAWTQDERKQVQIRRRFMLLGQTLDSMRVWDVRRAVQALRTLDGLRNLPLELDSGDQMAVNALYAAWFEPDIASLRLQHLPNSHRQGPDYLNVLRFLDIAQTVAAVADHCSIDLVAPAPGDWSFPLDLSTKLGWPKGRIHFESSFPEAPPTDPVPARSF